MKPLVLAWICVTLAGLALEALELRHQARHGDRVPPELEGRVDAERLRRIAAYTLDRGRTRMLKSLAYAGLVGAFFFTGGLASYDAWMGAQGLWRGVAFFLGLVLLLFAFELPFGWYEAFRIEARHGFNRSTHRLWVSDQAKALGVSVVLTAILTGGGLAIVAAAPHHWVWWVWGFFVVTSVLVLVLSPRVIEPLFFEFRPVAIPELEARIRALAERAGLRVGRILQVDAARRSAHSNAYFTGLGPTKRIVLFDTLLATMQPSEILAVLAHEIGHWRLRHVARHLVLMAAVALAALWVASRLVYANGLPGLVGMREASFPARALIVGFLGGLVAWPLTPVASGLSRRDEWQADRYAARLTGRPADLASALAELARDNLSNLHPHPLYAWWFASHPPVVQRLRALRAVANGAGA